MKLLTKLRADKRVDEICDERAIGNGWFVYLRGHCMAPGTGEAHCFGEDTLTNVRKTLSSVVKCHCVECNEETKP